MLVKKLRYVLWILTLAAQAASAAIINVAGTSQAGDRMGEAVAVGDFNCDQYDDLAIGVPGQLSNGVSGAGAVNVIYGNTGAGGTLGTAGNKQFLLGAFDTPVTGDGFGGVLATGDFDGDNCDDLAVGAPLKDIAGSSGLIADAGEVIVLYGHVSGLGQSGPEIWHQNIPNVTGGAEAGDQFGYSLVAGDFNGNGYDDLAIGMPGENNAAGAVYVLNGSPLGGLVTTAALLFTQDTPGIAGGREAGDRFGTTLASGNFNGDDYEDLAIGVPHEDMSDVIDAGAVHVIYGSAASLTATGNQLWSQGSFPDFSPGELRTLGTNEQTGRYLFAGEMKNNDGYHELLIGVPYESWGLVCTPVCVPSFHRGFIRLTGSASGLTTAGGVQFPISKTPGFGPTLGAVPLVIDLFGPGGTPDLLTGDPIALSNNNQAGGRLGVIYGFGTGGFYTVDQETGSMDDTSEAGDSFGHCLAKGEFNSDIYLDIVICVPGETASNGAKAGAVQVIYGSPEGVLSAGSQLFEQ